jgi:hypothetical protein
MVDTIVVHARDQWVLTPVCVQAGQTLSFSATGTWWDAVIPCSADGYAAPLFYAIGQYPRIRDNGRYFRLMGRVVPADATPSTDVPAATFPIGTNLRRVFHEAGRIFVFCNDKGGFYWNNWGSVMLTVERVG